MPGFNQKGSFGEGPMTGRKQGRCANFGQSRSRQNPTMDEQTNENLSNDFPFGRGFAFRWGRRGQVNPGGGRGRGMGWRSRWRGGENGG